MILLLSLLSLSPRVRYRHERLVVSTGWLATCLTLGLWTRRVTVTPAEHQFEITDRFVLFWQRRRRFSFGDIKAVTYGYGEETGISDYANDPRESMESFRVGLRLCSDHELHLFSFSRGGTAMEMLFSLTSTAERNSRRLVDVLSTMLGTTVIPPDH